MKHVLPLILPLIAAPVFAQDARQLDAHEHGVGALNIAFDGNNVAMEFHAPGADIVGFEYEAESSEDRAAIDAAVAMLARPMDLFVLPEAAACSVVETSAALESEEEHEGHDEHEAHEEHDDHADEDHDEHEEEHAHDDHEEKASHTEFHAEYLLNCANPEAITEITFAYFDTFENALEVEVQVVTGSGAQAFEVERDAPELDLRSLF